MTLLAFFFWAWAQSTEEHALLAQIQAYDTQIATLGAQLDGLDARARAAAASEAADDAAAKAAETDVAARRARTTRLVGASYRLERHGLLRLLFGAESPWELRRRLTYLRAVIAANETERQGFADASQARSDRKKAADESRRMLESLRQELAAQQSSLEAERQHRVALLHEIRGSPAKAAQAVVETAQARQELAQSMAVREATVTAAAAPTETSDFRQAKGHLPRPVNGPLARGFGPYVDPVSGQRSSNAGFDFAADLGTPFRSVAAGTVTRAAYAQGYGQLVVVQHGAYTTLYAHANGLRVAQGQQVHAGDVLGYVGQTGLADDTGCRLHFEIRYNNTPQDPQEWLAP